MTKFDAIIIGSGQAGTPLAFKLAAKGKSVAFIEKNKVGGTCVNVGCTPTKAYVASARRMWDVAHAAELGIEIENIAVANLAKIKTRKDAIVNQSVQGIEKGIEKNPLISFFYGEASFTAEKEVSVNGHILSAENIFINVGGRPVVADEYQDIPYYTNENILALTELPEHLIIIGGSYIGLEFGQMFCRFGSKVTIIEKGSFIISREDEETSVAIQEFIKADGVEIILTTADISASTNADGRICVRTFVNGEELIINGTHLLLAIGRVPNTDSLNLENAGVATDSKGFIKVNDYCETNVSGIFAMGDCNGQGAFTHTAYNDYQIVENFLFGDKSRKISGRILTYGLFVDPPLGRAGLTKKEALQKGYKVLEAKRKMSQIARAREKGETHGFMSVIVDADTDKILGACVLGTGGDEVITSILNIMAADVPYTLIRDTVVLHPTISELIPTMLENLKPVN